MIAPHMHHFRYTWGAMLFLCELESIEKTQEEKA
jgi:hypothetical protein